MRTIAVFSSKGGVGKSTLAVNVAACLAERGRKVLVVDLDPQATASHWLGAEDAARTVYDLYVNNASIKNIVVPACISGVFVAPADVVMATLEEETAGRAGRDRVLRDALTRVPGDLDFAFLDLPPGLGLLSMSGLLAAGEVLLPCDMSTEAVRTLANSMRTVEAIQGRANRDLRVLGVVLVRVQRFTKLYDSVLRTLGETYGPAVFRTSIRASVRVQEAAGFQRPLTVYCRAHPVTQEIRAVARELERRT